MARMREQIQSDATQAVKKDRRSRRRVSVYMNDDGTPDWSAVPEEHQRALGVGLGATAEPQTQPAQPEPIDPMVVGLFLQTMTSIEAAIVAVKYDLPRGDVLSALQPPQPMAEALTRAGAKVLDKYAGTLGRWQDEIVLASLVVTWQAQAFAQIRMMRATADEQKAATAQPSMERRESGTVQTSDDAPPVFAE